jgi:hypothetical protein
MSMHSTFRLNSSRSAGHRYITKSRRIMGLSLAIGAIWFGSCVASAYAQDSNGQSENQTAYVFFGYTVYPGTVLNDDEGLIVLDFLNQLEQQFKNVQKSEVQFIPDWTADNAATEPRLRPQARPPYDFYIIAWVKNHHQYKCPKDMNETTIYFEVGRLRKKDDQWTLVYTSYLQDTTQTFKIKYKDCGGGPQLIDPDGNAVTDTDKVAFPALAQYLRKGLPELQYYDTDHPFPFSLSCIDIGGENKPVWMVSDILASKDPPEDMSAQFLSSFVKKLIYSDLPTHWQFLPDEKEVDFRNWKTIETICQRGDLNWKDARVKLTASLREGKGGHHRVILEIRVVDDSLTQRFHQAIEPPNLLKYSGTSFVNMKMEGEQQAKGTLVRHCDQLLTTLYQTDSLLSRIARAVRNFVDQGTYHPDETKLECQDDANCECRNETN